MSTKKKIIVLVSMVLLLVTTTTLNIVLGLNKGDQSQATAGQAQADFYAAHRTLRTSNLDSLLLYYDSIINNTNLEDSSKAKEQAANEKLALLDASKKQAVMESAIKALGFDDVVVTIDTTGTNIYVVVKTNSLTTGNIDAIHGIVCDADPLVNESDIRVDNVY